MLQHHNTIRQPPTDSMVAEPPKATKAGLDLWGSLPLQSLAPQAADEPPVKWFHGNFWCYSLTALTSSQEKEESPQSAPPFRIRGKGQGFQRSCGESDASNYRTASHPNCLLTKEQSHSFDQYM